MQRIPSGSTNRTITIIAVDATDLKTRETGLTTFTVYRSRNGVTPVLYTTPTVTELSAANMPGVYTLTVDEDTTLTAGRDVEVMTLHVTQASMAPVSIVIELYRPDKTEGNTLDVTSTGAAGLDWGNIENKTTANDLSATDIQLVDTTTTNTDMVGTDGAFLAANAPTNFSDLSVTVTTGLVDITQTAADKIWSTTTRNLTALGFTLGASDLAADTITAAKIAADVTTEFRSVVTGTADSGSTTTIVDTERTEADTDYWKDAVVLFTSGTIIGQSRLITGFNAGTDTITFTPATTQAVSTNTYEILPFSEVDMNMEQLTPGSPTADTIGEALRRAHQQLPELPEKNAAFTFHFSMVDETDHVTPETGLSITANVAKDAASEGAAAGTVTEIGSGTYRFAATSADMNADMITFRFAATGADDTKISMMTTVAI